MLIKLQIKLLIMYVVMKINVLLYCYCPPLIITKSYDTSQYYLGFQDSLNPSLLHEY